MGWIEALCVHPEFQRFGVGRLLLAAMQDTAREHRITHAVIRVVDKATWALAFLARTGFKPLSDGAPQKVLQWQEERAEPALARPGVVVLWAAIPPKVEEPDEESDDATPS